jgi:hypothetical protein
MTAHTDCQYEEKTLEALTSGNGSNELADHWSRCAVCNNLRLAFDCLGDISNDIDKYAVPSPGLIWWRSEIEAKRLLAARSVSSIALFQKIAIAAATLLGMILIVIFAPRVIPATQTSMLVALGAFGLLLLSASAILYVWSRRDNSSLQRSSGHFQSII